jgi:small subunit ribosomal protein S17
MKTFEGKVIADRMNKAVVVLTERKFRHPLYGKILSRKRKIHAQNELGAKAGQMVKIVETRPLSKTITFKVVEILDSKMKVVKEAVKKPKSVVKKREVKKK